MASRSTERVTRPQDIGSAESKRTPPQGVTTRQKLSTLKCLDGFAADATMRGGRPQNTLRWRSGPDEGAGCQRGTGAANGTAARKTGRPSVKARVAQKLGEKVKGRPAPLLRRLSLAVRLKRPFAVRVRMLLARLVR
jgi:hypothetical protein